MTRWIRRGLLLDAPLPLDYAVSHAALPIVEPLEGSLVRVYFSPRDGDGQAHIGATVVDLASPERPEALETAAVLAPGGLGAFDDRGVTAGCLVGDGDRRLLYYSGWSLGVTVPFTFFVGCAVSEGGAPFTRVSPAPILDRSEVDPFLTASPWILVEDGLWRMWYVSGTGWRVENGAPKHWYHIKYAESRDGIDWTRDGRVCIDFADEEEYAIARPCVLRDGDRYRMWFSARGDRYRLGYAESSDGLTWERRDGDVELDPPPNGWDAEMQTYPCVFDHGNRRLMLYNGNGYGRTGVGWAEERRL